MGRLPSLIFSLTLGVLVCATACEEASKPATVTRQRSQAIESEPAAVAAASTVAPAQSAPARPKAPRKALCQGQMQEGKALPKHKVSRASAEGDTTPGGTIVSTGRWTWVNFWAAWCAPCKEEIPRLKSWERELAQKKLRVAFVSLDDDKRQLMQFLGESKELTQTYWLREGKERDDWMSAAGLGTDPELPFHLLVDPENKVRCRIQGAVEDADLPDLSRLLGAG
jgi:thiol-disulfide isomerase/thioredoxin